MNTSSIPRAVRRALGVALASALMMIPCTTVIAAETGVPLDAAHFPDPAFRAVVQEYDTDGNGTLSQQEIAEVTEIYTTRSGIKSAKGVEYLTALTTLNLGGNQLSSVDVSHNTNLTELWLEYNQLSSVDVSHNTNLTDLGLDRNQLSSVDVSHNTNLTTLYLYDNQLSSVDVSHNTKLTELILHHNQLSSVDVSHNTKLTKLFLDDNQLSSVDVSHNTNLTCLSLAGNQLSSVDVSHNTKLKNLWLGVNQLSSVDVSHNTKLTELQLYGNRLLWVGGVAESVNPDLSNQQEFGPVAASSLDLAKAAPGIDVSRISNVQGGRLQGTVLTPASADGLVSYDYRFSDTHEPLHAQVRFESTMHTVTFDANGGSAVASATVDYGKTAARPAAPTRDGYAFAGWYTAKDGGSKYDFAKPVTADLTLYAHWTIDKHTVTFDSNGGSTVASATVDYGKTAARPAAPTRDGYAFAGWYTAKDNGSAATSPSPSPPT